jgi:hypothetical protein
MDWSDRIGRRIKLRDLHVVLAVAESGSMTKASQKLAISHPVVSKTISDLEHMLGVKLFDRTSQGVEVTHSLALTYQNRILIGAFSGRFAEVALNGFRGGVQCFHIWRRHHRVNECRDDQAQEAPSAVFYAASRWGESPRWSATRGSVNSASNRLQRMWAFALLASEPGGPARPTPLLRCLKAISMRHRNR